MIHKKESDNIFFNISDTEPKCPQTPMPRYSLYVT
jgi:hypothetical protein